MTADDDDDDDDGTGAVAAIRVLSTSKNGVIRSLV
jgi:hypothetical protein